MVVLRGRVSLNSAHITASPDWVRYQWYNATWTPLNQIINCTNKMTNFECFQEAKSIIPRQDYLELIEINNSLGPEDAVVLIKQNDIRRASIYFCLDIEKWAKVIETPWQDHLKNWLKQMNLLMSKGNSIGSIFIKGLSNVGKSLFAKALANYMFTKISWGIIIQNKKSIASESGSIIILDIDIGQPIYGVPCCIKAYEVLKPILSNYEIRLNSNEDAIFRPISQIYIGEVTPYAQQDFYISMVQKLYNSILDLCKGK